MPHHPLILTKPFPKGIGITRSLAHLSHGNLAIALLSRSPEALSTASSNLARTAPGSVVETFPSDTFLQSHSAAFSAIRAHSAFQGLKLRAAVYNVKHVAKKPFSIETHAELTDSLTTYVGSAMTFHARSAEDAIRASRRAGPC